MDAEVLCQVLGDAEPKGVDSDTRCNVWVFQHRQAIF